MKTLVISTVIIVNCYAPSNSKPNQISVVFSSSAKGDLFTGAIGSQLDVNNFELNY